MKQALFEARHQPLWDALEQWLDPASKQRRPAQADRFAPQYRQLCQHLALARRRGYSPQLVNRLQTLVEQGHSELYRAAPVRWGQLPAQLLAGFPRTVRRHWRSMLVAALLFWGPLLAALVLLQFRPELAERVIDAASLAKIERMYDPSAERLGRDAGSDWMMFGHYILNNVSIGLRTFAGGLVLGIGAMAIVLFNGVYIGTVAGHLTANGYGGPFWQFVSGHSALELTAIVIAGGAGLQLGMRVLVPGRLSRRQALVAGGRDGAMLMLGVVVMLLGAAFVEAFWSARVSVPPMVKYSVGVLWWLLVLAWLVLGGRGGRNAA